MPVKEIALETKRKVNSVELQRQHWQQDHIFRLNLKSKHNQSLKKLKNKNSYS